MIHGKARAAEVIERKDVTPERIIAEIGKLYKNPDKVAVMSHNAGSLHLTDTNKRILAVIDKLIAKAK